MFCQWFWQERLWNSYIRFLNVQKTSSSGYKKHDAASIQIYKTCICDPITRVMGPTFSYNGFLNFTNDCSNND